MRRSKVDHPAPAALLHAGNGVTGEMKRARQVDGDDRVPLLGREFLDRRDVLNAGIVDDNVDPAELLLCSSEERSDLIGLGHVGPVKADTNIVLL